MNIQQKVKCLNTLGSFRFQDGGPPRSVGQISETLVSNHEIEIDLLFGETDQSTRYPLSREIRCHTLNCVPDGFLRRIKASGFRDKCLSLHAENNYDLVHIQGIWLRSSHDVSVACRRMKIPYIVSPRGMIESWSLKSNYFVKSMAMLLYQKHDLKSAAAFHATSVEEAENIRRLGLRQPIFLIPNGVDPVPPEFENFDNNNNQKRRILYFSRISKKKNIPTLLSAWARLAPQDAELLIVGNDNHNMLPDLKKLAGKLGIQDSVKFHGPIYGSEKEKLFSSVDLFVLPTFSENFGNVVAESLLRRVPVVTTTGTPWEGVVREKCGWWVDPTVEGIYMALLEALKIPPVDLLKMGERGAKWIQKEYSWGPLAEKMFGCYTWILGKGDRPKCIL